jgi:Ca-activated chloride channel family protein
VLATAAERDAVQEIPVSAWQFSVLGAQARIAQPAWLWAAVGAVVLTLLAVFVVLRREDRLRALVPERLRARVAPGAGPLGGALRAVLSGAALVLFAVALSQPQCGTRTELAKRFGVDLVVALDASRSMLARDVKPSRLERAKLELGALLDRLKGDRIGLVVFAGQAFVQCPLTTDYAAAKLFLRAVDSEAVPQQGTAVAEALSQARSLLTAADRGARSRVVVLLSDGEDHEGAALDEAEKLKQENIVVISVGVGSATGELIPVLGADGQVTGYKRDRAGNPVMTRLNETILKEIAEKTSGRYIHSAAGDVGVGEVLAEIDRMEKAELESRLTVQYDERYAYAAYPGFLLLLAAAVMAEGRWGGRRRAAAPLRRAA